MHPNGLLLPLHIHLLHDVDQRHGGQHLLQVQQGDDRGGSPRQQHQEVLLVRHLRPGLNLLIVMLGVDEDDSFAWLPGSSPVIVLASLPCGSSPSLLNHKVN